MAAQGAPAQVLDGRTSADVGAALRRLGEEAIRYAGARVESLVHRLEHGVAPSGAGDRAVAEGVKALVKGDNPVWAALRGAWVGADGKTKVAVVAVLLLVVVLAPVALLLLLLALLVAALVVKGHAAANPA